MLESLVDSYYWPGMNWYVPVQLATCPTCDKFQNHSKRQRAKLYPFQTNDREDIFGIDVIAAQASQPETARANRYILTMRKHEPNN